MKKFIKKTKSVEEEHEFFKNILLLINEKTSLEKLMLIISKEEDKL